MFAAQSSGSSTRVERAIVLDEPPSLDGGELTDKGTVNQRAVLDRRASLVERLYTTPYGDGVLCAGDRLEDSHEDQIPKASSAA
jgi:feruloyl-CoA synthase